MRRSGLSICGDHRGNHTELTPSQLAASGSLTPVFEIVNPDDDGRPLGLAIDNRGTLWVASSDGNPSSVINAGRKNLNLPVNGRR